MKERNYINISQKVKNGDFQMYSKHFGRGDWYDLLEDFINDELSNVYTILPFSHREHFTNIFLGELSETSEIAQGFITDCVNELLEINLKNKKLNGLSKLVKISSYLELNIHFSILALIVLNKSFPPEIRSNAASNINHLADRINFWNAVDLKKDNFLLPHYLMFFAEREPLNNFEILSRAQKKPQNLYQYEYILKDSLLTLCRYQIDQSQFITNLDNNIYPNWLVKYLNEIIIAYPELEFLQKQLRKMPGDLTNIILGISYYPDMILIDFLYQKFKSHFSQNGISINFQYFDWDKMLKVLTQKSGNLDLVIANQMVYLKSRSRQKYKYWKSIIGYEGFAIVSNNSLKSYEDILGEKPKNELRALQTFLEQLRNKKIYAALNTDHYYSLEALILKADMKMDEFEPYIIGIDPYTSLEEFVNEIESEEIVIYVGGMNQTANLESMGCHVILSEKSKNFGMNQFNGLISLSKNSKINEQVIKNIYYSLLDSFFIFESNLDTYLDDFSHFYNSQIEKKYKAKSSLYQLDKTDLKNILFEVFTLKDEEMFVLNKENEGAEYKYINQIILELKKQGKEQLKFNIKLEKQNEKQIEFNAELEKQKEEQKELIYKLQKILRDNNIKIPLSKAK